MRWIVAFGLAVLLAGCASGTRYADLPEKNFAIHTRAEGAEVVMGVHAVDARCKLTYEGYVTLEQPVTRVGIPPGRVSYLVFEFAHSSFWRGTRGSITREALLRPMPGARYELRVSYEDELYDVAIREVLGSRSRAIELKGLRACRSAS